MEFSKKKYILVLVLWGGIVIFSLCSFCGVLSYLYNLRRDLQSSVPVPDHSIKPNDEYKLVWSTSDLHVGCCPDALNLAGTSNKFIVQGFYSSLVPKSILTALDSKTGKVLWEIPDETGGSGKMIVTDQAIYRGTVYDTVIIYANSVDNGDLLWSKYLPLSHKIHTIYSAKKKVFVTAANSTFAILNDDGEILDDLFGTKNPYDRYLDKYLELDGILFMKNAPSGIKAVTLSPEKELWVVDLDLEYIDKPIFDAGKIFITSNSGTAIHSIDQHTGKVDWTVSQQVVSNLCVMDDRVYFINHDSYLVAIDRLSGSEVSTLQFSPKFDFEKEVGTSYQIACDTLNNILAISFGDNAQIVGLQITNP